MSARALIHLSFDGKTVAHKVELSDNACLVPGEPELMFRKAMEQAIKELRRERAATETAR